MSAHHRPLLSALLFIACGIGGMVAVLLHPESVNGPVWIGHAASGTFVLGGLAMLCQAHGFNRLYNSLILATLVALFAVGAWVSFGPGARACTAGLPLISSGANGLVCRGVFGLGVVVVGIMALWQLIRMVRGTSAA